ncbi:N-acetylneuraminate synthase family protein [Alphaproteobacteria bacterium]|nr:N-acetylneuraminate synthase family protein [Alphaproteobacteria bacterium]
MPKNNPAPIHLHRSGRKIGPSEPPYIIAEIGTNHNRSKETAKEMIHKIGEAGAQCVKFQIYEPNEIVSANVCAADYGLDHWYGNISAQEMFAKHLMTPKEWFPELKEECHALDLDFAATIHGPNGLVWSAEAKPDLIKIASMDHTNLPLLESLSGTVPSPILISFGMAQLADIDTAMAVLGTHPPGVGMFHCTAVYPPRPEELMLGKITYYQDRFDVSVGFSDHSDDTTTALASFGIGARFFEKHVTMDQKQQGPDHPFALEFPAFTKYVDDLQMAFVSIGKNTFREPSTREISNRSAYLKSLIATRDLSAGEIIKASDIYLARPGTGIQPKELCRIVGRILGRDVPAETPLMWEDLEADRG